ncbi:MAG: sulfite exporter TauE/SafE family protein [Ilumatobacteraceae bacterium]
MVLALLGLGLAAGILAGLLGVGGGIIMVPAMIILFGIPPAVAKGTSAAVIIPAAVMGTLRNRKTGNTDMRSASIIGVAGIVTAALGGIIADKMADDLSNVLFATLLVLVSMRLSWQLWRERDADTA